MIHNGILMVDYFKQLIILKIGFNPLIYKDSQLKFIMTKDSHLLYSLKLKEISQSHYSFMGILINNHHSKDGVKDWGPQNLLLKMENYMAEAELMMDILHMELC